MHNTIVEEIQKCPMVKNIPTGISRLLSIVSNEDLDIDELIAYIHKFPVICTRIIMVANSAWAAPKTEILDIKRACLQLGIKMVKSITIALLVSQQFNTQKCKGFSEKEYWLSSLIVSELMLKMEKNVHLEAASSAAHLVGLIHNIGLLVIAELHPDKFSKAVLLANNTEQTFSQSLIDVIGISYLQASAIILSSWSLPKEIAETYSKSMQKTHYHDLFFKALALKKLLKLNTLPYEIIEEVDKTTEELELLNSITQQTEIIENLCNLYCN